MPTYPLVTVIKSKNKNELQKRLQDSSIKRIIQEGETKNGEWIWYWAKIEYKSHGERF